LWVVLAVLVKIGDGLADGGLFDHLVLFTGSHQESGNAQAVNQARDAFGILVNTRQGVIGKERSGLVFGQLDVVTDIGDGLSQVKRRQVVVGGDALVKGFMGGQAQDAAQLGLANQEQNAQGLAVHIGGEEQAQGFEDSHGEKVGFVEDDERQAVLGVQQFMEGRADTGHGFGLAEDGFMAQGGQQVAVDTGQAQEGIGEVDDEIAVRIETGGETAHAGGLAGAGLAGDQAQAAVLEQVVQASAQLVLAFGLEELLRGDIFGEGQAGEAEELLQHVSSPGQVWAAAVKAGKDRPSTAW